MTPNPQTKIDAERDKLMNQVAATTDLAQLIALYKLGVYLEKQFALLKEFAYTRLQGLFLDWSQQTGKEKFEHPLGSCGWTEPKTKKLNDEKWQAALMADADLAALAAEYTIIEARLKVAQMPYMELPKPKFYAK